MLRRLSGLITALALLLFSGAPFAADPMALHYYEDAVSRFSAGDAEGAAIQLRNALQRDPGQLPAKILLGRTLLALGDPLAAEEELLQAQQLGADPLLTALPLARARNALGKHQDNLRDIVPIRFPRAEQPDLWVELGLARLFEDDPDGAAIAFQEALKIVPGHVGARVGQARIPLQRKDFADAGRRAEAILVDAPDHAGAWFIKGSALHALGRFQAAAEAYARAYQIDRQQLPAALGEAAALLDAGQAGQAAARLRALRDADPERVAIPYLLYQALSRTGQADQARQALDEAAGIVTATEPSDIADRPAELLMFGSIAFESGQLERAYRFLDAYVNSGGADSRGRKMLARSLIAMGRPGDALRVLVRLSANRRADAETLMLQGDANIQLGDFEAAQRQYRAALTDRGGGPAIARRLAMAEYQAGQRQRGLETLQALLEQLPAGGDPSHGLLLGFLYLAEQRPREAEGLARHLLAGTPDDPTVRNLLAAALLAQGRADEARELFEQILDQAPEFRPALLNRIKLDIADGAHARAARSLAELLARDPNDPQALLESAHLAELRGDRREAIRLLERLRGLRPASHPAARRLVAAYLADGRPGDALQTAHALDAARPKSVAAQRLLASALAANGDPTGAREALKRGSSFAGNDARQLYEVGSQQMQMHAFEDAAWTFTKILALAPNAVDARFNLATSLLRQRKVSEAELEVARLRERHPDLVIADILLADVRQAQGRLDEAIDLYRGALQRTPSEDVVDSLYRALLNDDQPEQALATLQHWLEAHPDSTAVLTLLADHHLTRGRRDAARPLYQRLAEMRPDDPRVLNNLAMSLSEFDNERALKAAMAAHRLSPHNPFVLDTLGWALIQIGDLERGLGHLREARARNGRSPTIRYHLGVALHEYGSHGSALFELREALRLGGEDFVHRADILDRITRLEAVGG